MYSTTYIDTFTYWYLCMRVYVLYLDIYETYLLKKYNGNNQIQNKLLKYKLIMFELYFQDIHA